ncbi:MAG TPA: MBOAT family O-acyltransferase, partial [Chitinophagaceae bacterium]|nr:MBOAT family O-acyltransferase [Chitinophagaceae bacterium]
MVFSSPVFLFYFLPLIIVFYFATRRSIYLQNLVLCIGSLLFYFWGEKEYTLLVILSILMNYMFGLGIAAFTRSTQRLLLFLGIVLNLSLLLYFKYYNFWMNEIMHSLFHTPLLKKEDWVHLPLGISFFTFHGLTYITDIYRKEAQVSHNPLNAGLYILFFPQLIAGPIVRYRDMDAQLRNRRLDTALLRRGVQRFIVGLAKKMLIANTCGEVADKIFSMKEADVSGSITWLALIC